MTHAAQAAPSSAPDHLILGRYRALRPLGSGGSGTVWLAHDEHDDRQIALKIVPREGKAGERAEREALAVARLQSRRCARAYAVARDERHVYVAYEYVAGKTMREAIRTGALNDRSTVEAAAQVLDALAHAHRRGIVHRDVKPSNILVEDGAETSVCLLDFGLAQLDEADTLTAAGDVPGTLAYISPERLDGKHSTGAADVWAVGVILWESLAGYQPFWSSSPVETAKLIGAGPRPLRSVRPDLPKPLAATVDRALALDPRRRPAPERLAAELRRCLEEAAERRTRRRAASGRDVAERAVGAALAACFVTLATGLLPFYPSLLIVLLTVLTALLSFSLPRAGLALTLAIPLLPLGNLSLGLALAYVPLVASLLALQWRDARHGLLFVAGPLLALVGALPLVPLVAAQAGGPARRFVQGAGAVLAAALVAGLRGTSLPLTGEPPPHVPGIAGADAPADVAGSLWAVLANHPGIGVAAIVLGAASAALPLAVRFGPWSVAGLGACLMGAILLVPALTGGVAVSTLPVVLGTWLVCTIATLQSFRPARARQASAVQ